MSSPERPDTKNWFWKKKIIPEQEASCKYQHAQ